MRFKIGDRVIIQSHFVQGERFNGEKATVVKRFRTEDEPCYELIIDTQHGRSQLEWYESELIKLNKMKLRKKHLRNIL